MIKKEAVDEIAAIMPYPRRTLGVTAPQQTPKETTPSHNLEEIEKRLIAYGEALKSRDSLLKEAKSAGISEARIARLTGHSRNTVRSALASGVIAGSPT